MDRHPAIIRIMIRRSTVFILGAGASKPYGFPTGEELFRTARSLNSHSLKDKLLATAIEEPAKRLHERLSAHMTHL